MKAIDTFRTPPYAHNCAQAVANHWKELYGDPDIVASYAPYVGGRAPEGFCGALFAAMQACPNDAEKIKEEFSAEAGAAYCRQIKAQAKTPCVRCVEIADSLVEKYKR